MYFPLGSPVQCVLGVEIGGLGGREDLAGPVQSFRVHGWLLGPQPALPSTVRLISPNPLV